MRQKRSPATSEAPQLGQLTVSVCSARILPFPSHLRVCSEARPAGLPAGGVLHRYTPVGAPRLHPAPAGLRLVPTLQAESRARILARGAPARKRLRPDGTARAQVRYAGGRREQAVGAACLMFKAST